MTRYGWTNSSPGYGGSAPRSCRRTGRTSGTAAAVVAAERERLALDGLPGRGRSTGFVRNRLMDEVYLPLVGDSLAKQFGPAGGLLMLMSPPGYGKTSLVEYVAARLGLALVSVSGPALGTGATSLDPDRAPDAAARREVEKVRLRAGTRLQRAAVPGRHPAHLAGTAARSSSRCATRSAAIEGPDGRYDLRGKRFAVCMAGNPYTESGALFRVPDMLANRADVWNLGDVLTGREALFALSYVENALTANPVLAPLAGRDRADLELLVRLAEDDPTARTADLVHPYPAAERAEVLTVLRHMLRARATLLAVNAAYIASAARPASARTEPPFLLQGSYRAMARIAGRITPTMNDRGTRRGRHRPLPLRGADTRVGRGGVAAQTRRAAGDADRRTGRALGGGEGGVRPRLTGPDTAEPPPPRGRRRWRPVPARAPGFSGRRRRRRPTAAGRR